MRRPLVKALVTGANGFLGVSLVERLLARGATDLRCLVRPGSARARLAAALEGRDGAEMFEGSLSTREGAAAAIENVDVIYHLAAALKGAPADMFLGTVVSTRNLLDAVAASGRPIKLVHVSSLAVYGVADLRRGARIDENVPLETQARRRDPYAQVKLWQERLVVDRAARDGFPLVVLRPGVIYGPAGSPVSARVGIKLPGVFLHLGGSNTLPLSYVDNCAEAIAVAGAAPEAVGSIINVVDDDLISCRRFLRMYNKSVTRVRSVFVPYPVLLALSGMINWYHHYSKGQLPAVLTPYRVASSWRPAKFDNAQLKSLGWRPLVSTAQGLQRTFQALHARHAAGERLI